MPMNEEVRKAVEYMDNCIQTLPDGNKRDWQTISAELTRLTEIAEGVEGTVFRLHDVTEKLEAEKAEVVRLNTECQRHFTQAMSNGAAAKAAERRLEAANALLREAFNYIADDGDEYSDVGQSIQAHLSEPRT